MSTNEEIYQRIEGYLHAMEEDKPARAYEICRRLSRCVKELILRGDTGRFRSALVSVIALHKKARCSSIRMAIENVFIYNISDAIMLQEDRQTWAGFLPRTFREKMCQQIFASGI